ncbi:hypothetical protein [Microbacterium testaceum]|uniref:Uncharacterized protein n=1 Tax=Microbacterium testaceum TaxID=2033 RepID=A0A2T7WNE4_MICTE|nr:hypothetical protein [Microbacterium testaceum]PVE76098.1 hypothetical protein DC432_06595 [Microbacterium testaceum]
MVLEVMPSAKAQIQFPLPIVVTPGVTLWASNFDAWPAALSTSALRYWSNTGVSNSQGAEWDRSSAGGSQQVGTLTGLTIGRSYTFRAVVKGAAAGATFYMTAAGTSSASAPLTTSYAARALTFTATATSHALTFYVSTTAKVYLDDVSFEAGTVIASSVDLPVAEGDLSLDRSRVPYAVSRVTVPSINTALPESLKPLDGQRVKLTAQAQGRWGTTEPTYSSYARIRQNTFFDPRGTSTSQNYWVASGFNLSLRTDMGNPTPTAVRFTRTTTAAARVSVVVGTGFPQFASGVRILATVRASVAMPGTQVYSRPTASSATSQVLLGTVNIPAGVSEIDVTGTPHSGTNSTSAGISLTFPTVTTTGQTLDITRVIVERKPDTLPAPYFDGGTVSTDPLVTYQWDGLGTAPNRMSSILTRTVTVPGVPVWIPSDTRTFDMAMLSREVSHDGRSVDLELATDEALLMNYSTLTDDYEPMQRQDSLRSIVNYVLDRAIPGAQLQATGAADRPFSVLSDSTNLVLNPRITDLAPHNAWNVSRMYDTTWPGTHNGVPVNGVHLYNPTGQDSYVEVGSGTQAAGMQPGRTYTASMEGSVRTVIGGTNWERQRALVMHAYSPTNGYSIWNSAKIPNAAGSSARVSITFTIPSDATQWFLRAYHGGSSGTITWAKPRVSETHKYSGPHNIDFFNGQGPNTSEYAYSWSGASDNSASRRFSLIDRAPDLLVWRAGESAWDFLETLKNAAGLRLFCDEQRRWWLVDGAEWDVPGRVSVRANNTIEGTDIVDAAGDSAAQGVIARFSWRDTEGNQKTKDDVAGNAGRALLVEFDRPYPGPGTAAAILSRRAGQGRTQDVTILSDLSVTPGQEISITLPGTENQLGTLQSAQFDLANGSMRLESTGLTEVTPGSWLAEDPANTWSTTPDTRTWANS